MPPNVVPRGGLYTFARSVIIKYHQLGGLKKTEVYSLTVLEARGPKARCQQGHTLSEALSGIVPRYSPASGGDKPILGSLVATSLHSLLLPSHGVLSASLFTLPSSSHKENGHIGSGPALVTSPSLDCICKDQISKEGHSPRYQDLGLQHIFLEGHKPTHNRHGIIYVAFVSKMHS